MKMTIKYLLAFGLAAGALGAATLQVERAHAQTRQVDCEVSYEGASKIKSRCEFVGMNDYGPGSFRINKTTGANTIFGQVLVTSPGVGDGSIGSITGDSEELIGSGEVRRNGACWEGNDVKICARSLTSPPAVKAKAPAKAPPKKAVPR